MSFPNTELYPDDQNNLPPARRRREHRLLAPLDAGERAAFVDELAHQASPSFDFFAFSLLGGLIMSIGIVLDSPALLLAGSLLAPFMAPLAGIALGAILGSAKFFARTFAGFLVGSLLVFGSGSLVGLASHTWMRPTFNQAYFHTSLTWPDFAVLVAGTILFTYLFVKSDTKPVFPGIILAYELYLPAAIAGVGLGYGGNKLFPDALMVYGVYISAAILSATVVLVILGFRPLKPFGYTLGSTLALLSLVIVIGLSGAGAAFHVQITLPTPVPTSTWTPSPSPYLSPTSSRTSTSTRTPTVTPTLTASLTPTLTPVPAIIAANERGGARVRSKPGYEGSVLITLNVSTPILLFSESVVIDDETWVHIRTIDGKIDGWCVVSLLKVVTPTITQTP